MNCPAKESTCFVWVMVTAGIWSKAQKQQQENRNLKKKKRQRNQNERQKWNCDTRGLCTMKPFQLTQDIFLLSGLTNPNIGCLGKRCYKAGYQLVWSTLGFSIQLRACACERGRAVNHEQRHQNHVWSRLLHMIWDEIVLLINCGNVWSMEQWKVIDVKSKP